jgi:hypothetical protein
VSNGSAFTNRTFRFLFLTHFAEGIDLVSPGPFPILNDGVFQDDDLTARASIAYDPSRTVHPADMGKVRRVRLPFFKFNHNPPVPINSPRIPETSFKDLPLPQPRKET